ncbi:hypothetical protein Dimus_030080 [Dionaea muscipula]
MGQVVQEKGTNACCCLQVILCKFDCEYVQGEGGNTGICEYIKDVWEESKFCKPLEIIKKFANDELLTAARRVRSTEMKPFQRRLVNLPRVMLRHITYVISVENHELPYGDWLTMVFEEFKVKSGSAEKFYDAKDEVQGSADVIEEVLEVPALISAQQKETATSGVDPLAPTGSIPDSVFLPLQAELERARADRI